MQGNLQAYPSREYESREVTKEINSSQVFIRLKSAINLIILRADF